VDGRRAVTPCPGVTRVLAAGSHARTARNLLSEDC
jgi:hypothetical protein